MKVLVIGAQNIDIFAQSSIEYVLKDSNPSKIHLSFGGVGRNMAENLKRLGNDVHFLTVFADDFFAKAAKQSLIDMNINILESIDVKDQTNSIYMGIMDKDNDLFLGLNDMDIINELNIDVINSKIEYINTFDYLVIDNNLEETVISHIVNKFEDKIIVMDAVSAKKVNKLNNILSKINYLKLNHIELCELAGEKNIMLSINKLNNKGAKTLLITNQSEEIIVSTKNGLFKYKPLKIDEIINATGAGDAFISGFTHGLINGYSLDQRIDYAISMAHLTLQSNNSTNEHITLKEVEIINEKLHRI